MKWREYILAIIEKEKYYIFKSINVSEICPFFSLSNEFEVRCDTIGSACTFFLEFSVIFIS